MLEPGTVTGDVGCVVCVGDVVAAEVAVGDGVVSPVPVEAIDIFEEGDVGVGEATVICRGTLMLTVAVGN